jgi:site-specific recombinase XerD
VDIRIIQLMLGHASIQQTQRYLNVTHEELRTKIGLQIALSAFHHFVLIQATFRRGWAQNRAQFSDSRMRP